MSPYLFVIAMEVLSKILAKRIEDSSSFSFIRAHVVKAALDEFSLLLGLHANHAKSNIFTSGVSYTINQQLINLFGYTSLGKTCFLAELRPLLCWSLATYCLGFD
ncbi:hypothetical protein Dsin_001827 [Dipteronia sinensis]|uniref:Uncharacterized protein n=1 Tax=Dipteronia sinensis TaxID=43782 RepID=A0AAE0B4M5_9ROSI|nr:hypothetical protein Dsin_001827 [Dipteronia sinensis]